jgi:hypothetical protein
MSAVGEADDQNYVTIGDIKSYGEVPLIHIMSGNSNRLVTIAKKKDLPKTVMGRGVKEDLHMEDGNTQTALATGGGTPEKPEGDAPLATASTQEVPAADITVSEVYIAIPETDIKETLGQAYTGDQILQLAKDGIQLKKELVEDTLSWGVRAQGNAFTKETWVTLLNESTRTLLEIQNFRASFMVQAKETIPAGRQTQTKTTQSNSTASLPDEFYKA